MAKTRELPLQNYANGTYTKTKNAPNGLSGFDIRVGRCTTTTPTLWPNASTVLKIKVEGSYDGGASYTGGVIEITDPGGTKLDKAGAEIVESVYTVRFYPDVNHVRITATIAGGPLYSYVDVSLL